MRAAWPDSIVDDPGIDDSRSTPTLLTHCIPDPLGRETQSSQPL